MQSYDEAVARATTPPELWAVFAGHFQGSDITRLSYLHLPPLGAPDENQPQLKAEGFPDALVARYARERLFRANPIINHAMIEVEPVYWDEIESLGPLSEREQAFLDDFRAEDLGYGVGIPVYGPSGRMGQCGLGFRRGVRRLSPEVLSDAQWACQLAHLRYCAIMVPTLAPSQPLSGRETEVLAWVARGKSNQTIGEILGISSATVNAHMRRIYLKLGVFDRITAAIRGIGCGLIHAET
jgi:LuxR family transcriptional regulator, quorum-sensing system regulator CciR